jgi:hypothetical protein
MRRFALTIVLALAACVDAGGGSLAVPPEGTPHVEIYGGGGFAGWDVTRVYAGDVLVAEHAGPGGENLSRSVRQGEPGTYDRVRALVLREGPKVARRLPRQREDCMDYGADSVALVPAEGGFDRLSRTCPDQTLLAFQQQVADAIAAP